MRTILKIGLIIFVVYAFIRNLFGMHKASDFLISASFTCLILALMTFVIWLTTREVIRAKLYTNFVAWTAVVLSVASVPFYLIGQFVHVIGL